MGKVLTILKLRVNDQIKTQMLTKSAIELWCVEMVTSVSYNLSLARWEEND